MEKNTISKFFDVLSSKINCCFLTKNTVSKLNFLKFEERNSIDYLSNLWLRFWRTSLRLPIMLAVILMTGYVSNGQSIKGVVPVQCPHGGSGVDGDAFADTPVIGIGDLFDNNAGSGGGVINLAPPPEFLCSGPTFRLADAWGGDVQDPTIFTLSNKINDNPGDPDGPGPLTGGYTWGAGSSPNKNEIQNCGVHFTYGDPNVIGTVEGTSYAVAGKSTDLWCLFAGDRQVTNGSSYIDFEFLQATLSMFGTTSGGFVSQGTDGGRTLGDILVTIEFTQGGGDATVVIRRWEAKAGGGFEYVVRPNSLFQGGIYCTNNTSPTFVPFDVYGSGATGGTYAVNQWAEGAINLTKVFGLDQPGHECFVLSTVFIRTRSSGSSAQSELKDFPGAPIQLNLCTDETPPVISALPAPTTVECPGTPSFATPTATDNCELKSLTFADVTTPGGCPQEYSVTRTWTATDACGNVSTASQTIGVTDNTAPTLSSLPAPSSVECPATPSFATPTATDACDTSVTPTFADVTTPGGCPQEYSVTRTWTATDDCGNSSTASQTISVTDNTAPVLSALPAPSSIECPATPVFTTPTATDACDASVTPTFADVTTPGSCPQEYSVTRTWTATDDCGNSSSASQTISVTDNTAPVLSALPAPSSVECPATPVFTTPTATDACDTSVTPTFADVTTPGSCPQEYSVTRTWTATDDCGNSSSASQTISVTDNTAPVLSALPAPSSVECPATPVFTTPTATDACDTSVTPTFADVTTPGSCPQEYSVTRTWTATDDCGNSSSTSQTISVTDNTAPVLSALPAPSSVECPATPVFATPTATDACDTSVTPTFADVTIPGSCPQEYSVTRTWTATDDCGNSSSASQTIGVTDNTAPVISALPAPSSVECPATPVFTTPTATDACDTSVTPTFADVTTPGSCPQEYSVTRTWTATDDCGNSSTASQTISVTDDTVPTITCVANKTIECNAEFIFDPPTATDSCSGTATVSIVSTVTNPDGSQTRTWKATDACGNESAPCSQTISVAPCAHIFPTQTTCCHFSTGTAIGLNNVCTTVSGTTVTNAVPGVFFYYSNVIAPAASFTIVVKQSNDGDLSKLFSIQNSGQLRLFTSSCETVTFTGSVINGGKDASYSVTGATPGATYIVSVKYDVKSIIGAVYSGADLVSKYTFASFINGSLTAAPGSTGTIDAVAGCTDNTPLPGSCSIAAKAPTTIDIAPIEAKIENVGFDAYPVPFKDQLTIKYKFDYTSDVKIELFNAQGILVLSKTDTHSYLNKEITLNLKASKGQEQVYVVKVTTNRGTTSKKVMSSR